MPLETLPSSIILFKFSREISISTGEIGAEKVEVLGNATTRSLATGFTAFSYLCATSK
uniref:Uncharacterized protein n=1 Tax=viral metagenome TaxID=1070528 RepID=A0A6C0F433_9ZZZZ